MASETKRPWTFGEAIQALGFNEAVKLLGKSTRKRKPKSKLRLRPVTP